MSVNRMVASMCVLMCALAGFFVVGLEQAEAKNAVASRTAQVKQQLSAAHAQRNAALGAVRFFKENPKNRWMLHLRYKHLKCWDPKLPLKGPARLCIKSRAVVRVNTRKLAAVNRRIANLRSTLRVLNNYYNWMCIHRHEGAWSANTGNGYYGGLQMDMDFQRTYGPEFLRKFGTADKWPPNIQMLVAQRAYDGFAGYGPRGFHPWPNTARYCGLI